jgi:hypothetical protein
MSVGGKRRYRNITVAGLVVLGALAGTVAWALKYPVDERPVRSRLAEMGIIATLDTNGRSIGSVNLATIKDRSRLPEALELVLQLKSITSLGLNGLPIVNADLERIAQLPTLLTLSLSDCDVGGAGYQALSNLDDLQYLHLPGTKTADEDLESLADLASLVSIDLSRTKVGKSLWPLTRLPRLKWLLLSQDAMADSALSELTGAPAISRLTLFEAAFSESDLQALQAAKPNLNVDR